jgi:HSP20 family protein
VVTHAGAPDHFLNKKFVVKTQMEVCYTTGRSGTPPGVTQWRGKMRILNRWEPNILREQINRAFADVLERTGEESNLTVWAPAVDIFETEHELVVKADLPDVDPKDLDIQIQNNILTIRGERNFEKNVKEENYLRVERAYGSFSRSFSLANTVNSDAIKADYKNGVLTLSIPKREEAKPKQVKVNVATPAMAATAGAR